MRERLNIWMISASSGLILLALAVEPQTVFPQKMSYAAGGTVRRPSPAPRSTGALIEIEPLPRYRDVQGTAFSISVGTRWMTARHVIENCNSGRLSSPSDDTDLEELLVSQEDDVAIVRSLPTSAPHFRFAKAPPAVGDTAYLFGFPQGGEYAVSVKLMGSATARQGFRPYANQPVLLWVESGSMPGGTDELSGMSGGPTLNSEGEVVGVFSASDLRRGRIVTANPWALANFDKVIPQRGQTVSRPIKGLPDAVTYLRQMIRAKALRELDCET